MKILFFGLMVTAATGFAAEAAKPAKTLNENYTQGLLLMAETRNAMENSRNVLGMVEEGADAQAERIAEMEAKLNTVKITADALATESGRRVITGAKLLLERDRLQSRFETLERALKDDRALLSGATKTVQALLDAADKSGKTAERQLADSAAASLKLAAEQIRLAQDRLAQTQLRVQMETTLLRGLLPRATAEEADIGKLRAVQKDILGQVVAQRAGIDKLNGLLAEGRDRLTERGDAFGKAVEAFRLVQVSMLRRWLMDGPPAGEIPSLSIEDVLTAGLEMNHPKRPDPSSTLLGPGSGGEFTGRGIAAGRSQAGANSGSGEVDVAQVSAEVIRLNKQAQWYLAMLWRLTTFSGLSLEEAGDWTEGVEGWRNELSWAGRTLADQRGMLTALQMEQGMVATTVELMAVQANTALGQVDKVIAQIDGQIAQLNAITAELKAGG